MTLDEWNERYGSDAYEEGWGLFEPADNDHEPLELQALDDEEYGDDEAWRLVITGALNGNARHQAALMVLHALAPAEFTFITRHTLGGAYA